MARSRQVTNQTIYLNLDVYVALVFISEEMFTRLVIMRFVFIIVAVSPYGFLKAPPILSTA